MCGKCKLTSLLICILVFAVMLVGCGTKETVNVTETEVQSVVEETAELVEDAVVETIVEETSEEETTEEVVEQIVLPQWYLDEEGLKNDELNVLVGKSAEGVSDHQLNVTLAIEGMDLPFYCSYSDSNLDEYISQRENMKKGQVGNIEFAYDEEKIVFIGNGLEIRSSYAWWGLEEGNNLVDWLEEKNIVKTLEEPLKECMAYSTKNGLYCPAMGISICKEGAVDGTSAIGATYSYEQEEFVAATISFSNDCDTHGKAQNAQEVLDNYKVEIEGDEILDLTWVDSSVVITLGNEQLIGGGYETDYQAHLCYYPDSLEYYISIYSTDKAVGEIGLSSIEQLK